MATLNTRTRLHRLIDDMEMVAKELVELMSIPKHQQKTDGADTVSLMELLIEKDAEIKAVLELAEEQAKIQKVMDALKQEVDKRDAEIKNLQRSLKDAEMIMSTAIYQGKQKLKAVNQANERSTSSEEIIKFAHRISASNAVAAPITWGPGDPRRPYPTDLEMRQGWLGMAAGANIPELSRHATQTQVPADPNTAGVGPGMPPMQGGGGGGGGAMPVMGSSLSWQPSQEVAMTLTSTGSHHGIHDLRGGGHNKENEDVELMSSDSSSSSSSDEE
ncbi:mediator of RNA polymerase II transcription subunit 4-like [Babylonia areolata]|uniref:mediator of RNA polymerase II transcription subunit 4-like n=1 Tax=Babylonia areolata TaxID=304850 RepID=UPI003FD0E4FE